MTSLENFIKNSRDTFDSEEPSVGHEERFFRRIQRRKTPMRNILFTVMAAAVLLLIMVITPFVRENSCKLNPELMGIHQFYREQLECEKNELEKILSCAEESVKKEILKDVSQIASSADSEKLTLCHEQNNLDVLDAYERQYQVKIEAIQVIAVQMQRVLACK
jgi:hypothetical protein